MSKKSSRLVVFTSSNINFAEDELKKVLLWVLQIHFDKEMKKK